MSENEKPKLAKQVAYSPADVVCQIVVHVTTDGEVHLVLGAPPQDAQMRCAIAGALFAAAVKAGRLVIEGHGPTLVVPDGPIPNLRK